MTTINEIVIKDWQQYGDYMRFANLVDGETEADRLSVILETTSSKIRVIGSSKQLDEYSKRIANANIEQEIFFTYNTEL